MNNDLYESLSNFLKEEKMTLNLTKVSDNEFWLDGPEKKITVKILIDTKARKILYDVYSVIDIMHLKERTLKEKEQNIFIQEEHRRWNTAKILEEVWMVVDELGLWSEKNKYSLKEAKLI
jgi:hypothetical protein